MLNEITIPGVFVSIFDVGCLITGDSGVGKSELALELIDRGHALISDDAVNFHLDDKKNIVGTAPKLLESIMHIRDIGVINIEKSYGKDATKKSEILSWIISLAKTSNLPPEEPLQKNTSSESILKQPVNKLTICHSQSRPLSLVVETFVKNVILSQFADNPIKEFMAAQQKQLEANDI